MKLKVNKTELEEGAVVSNLVSKASTNLYIDFRVQTNESFGVDFVGFVLLF